MTQAPERTLGEAMRKARKDAGLEQQDVAEKVGVSRALVSKWERDVTEPTFRKMRTFVDITGAEWLLEGHFWLYLRAA
jgi:transcriptional regulator with XRE-family HTH domain